jgi:hypothetical protein
MHATATLNLRLSRRKETSNQKKARQKSSQIHYGPNTSMSAMMKAKAQSQACEFQ